MDISETSIAIAKIDRTVSSLFIKNTTIRGTAAHETLFYKLIYRNGDTLTKNL